MPGAKGKSELEDARSTDNAKGDLASGWPAGSATFAGIFISLVLIAVAGVAAFTLHAFLGPMNNVWLPSTVDLITSDDTRPQRWGFLIAAILFATTLTLIVFFRPAALPPLDRISQAFFPRLDLALRLAVPSKLVSWTGPSWLRRCILAICLVGVVAFFASEQARVSAYVGGLLILVTESDPHIYAIFGQAGETLAGRFASDTANSATFYGLGPAVIYAIGRFFGATGGYNYAYQIARWSNLVAVAVLFWGLFRPQFSRLAVLPAVVIALAAICVTLPLLMQNNFSAFAANLSGLRYVPMLLFIIAAGLVPRRRKWLSIIFLACFAGLGFAYSADVGVISLLAYIVFVGLDEGGIVAKILSVLAFLGATFLVILALDAALQSVFPIGLLGVLNQVASAEDGGFGGVLVKFSLINSLIVVLFVVTASSIALESTTRSLEVEERFIAAVAIMGFVWYSYYLHRPSDHWIFAYLALFVLRYLLARTSNWATSARRVGAVFTVALVAVIAQQTYKDIRTGLLVDRMLSRIARTQPVSTLSGIRVEPSFGAVMNTRIDVLDQMRTTDSIVVTAFPYLMSTSSHVVNPPKGIVFTMPAPKDIDAFVANVLAKKPSRLFLEPHDTLGWGPEVANAAVERIEQGLSAHYKRDEKVSAWRVWNAQ